MHRAAQAKFRSVSVFTFLSRYSRGCSFSRPRQLFDVPFAVLVYIEPVEFRCRAFGSSRSCRFGEREPVDTQPDSPAVAHDRVCSTFISIKPDHVTSEYGLAVTISAVMGIVVEFVLPTRFRAQNDHVAYPMTPGYRTFHVAAGQPVHRAYFPRVCTNRIEKAVLSLAQLHSEVSR